MAKKKLTLSSVKKSVGIGAFVSKQIQYRGIDGEMHEGEILIKVLSHDDRINAINHWKLKDRKEVSVDQLTKAIIFESVYSSEDERFFPKIENTGEVSSELIDAMYKAADEVMDFSGKHWISKQKNFGENSSSAELVEEPLKKQSEE